MERVAYRARELTLDEQQKALETRAKRAFAQSFQLSDDKATAKLSGHKYSANGSIQFQDHDLGHQRALLTVRQVDALAHQQRRVPDYSTHRATTVPSLSSLCLRLVNLYYQDFVPALGTQHRLQLPAILRGIRSQLPVDGGLPFDVWVHAALHMPADIPLRFRTYRGLALRDVAELGRLEEVNEAWAAEWKLSRQITPAPRCLVGLLDFTGLVTFGDEQVWRVPPQLRSFMVALILAWTTVTDKGIAALVQGGVAKLELLSLRGLVKVTDGSAQKLGKNCHALRMIDLRDSSCTPAFRHVLRESTPEHAPRAPWRPAVKRPDLAHPEAELDLFHYKYSLSALVTRLRALAPPPGPVAKPLCVLINKLIHPEPAAPYQSFVDQFEASRRVLPSSTTAFSHLYGLVTSTRKISGDVLAQDASDQDKGRAWRTGDDKIAGGGENVAQRQAQQAVQRLRSKRMEQERSSLDSESDWGSEDEAQQSLRTPAPQLPDFYLPVPRTAAATPTHVAGLLLVRHLSTILPPATAPPRPTKSVPALLEGSRLVAKKRPLEKQPTLQSCIPKRPRVEGPVPGDQPVGGQVNTVKPATSNLARRSGLAAFKMPRPGTRS